MWGQRPSTILIVDEEDSEAGLEASFLRQSEVRVLRARAADEARTLARSERPSLIVGGVAEAAEASLDLIRRLKGDRLTRAIPLIAVAEEAVRERAAEAGADVVLPRPPSDREYWQAVRRFVRLPKRRDLRQIVNLRVTYRFDGRTWQAFSRDLSAYGAFLKTDQALEPGSRIRLTFGIPGEAGPVECDAVVRYCTRHEPHQAHHPTGFAVEFDGLAPADSDRLQRFVHACLRRQPFGLSHD